MSENRNRSVAFLFVVGGVLLMAAVLVWVSLSKPAAPAVTPTPGSVAEVQRVTPAEAKAALDAGEAVIVDVRDINSYTASHIGGALSIPINELPDRIGELNPSSWVITYCT
jgi:3-mercaptopyruvate sulfurtransferase SseA